MTDATSSNMKATRNLVRDLEASLKAFQSSASKFRVLKTLYPNNRHPSEPSAPYRSNSPRTLLILDSSFNPPSIAHHTLAQSILERERVSRYAAPVRLLLLFAVTNADKAPSPAAFGQRLAMMTVFANDLLDSIIEDPNQTHTAVPVDIGVTTAPYYTDKSAAIETDGLEWYPDKPKHVHLIGFDTLTRFFAAKYYQKFDPPFSALNPFFDKGHSLQVTLRPDDDYGTVDEQRAFHKQLEDGDMDKDGAKKSWAKQVQLVPPNPEAGVSSTKIRKAAKSDDWDTVGDLCTAGVAGWVRDEKLYSNDDEGAKMAE